MLTEFKTLDYLLQIAAILYAIVPHEVAHGFAALKMGDPTAKLAGRLTLNPISHLDLFGSIILPGILIFSGSPVVLGYAKPVPVRADLLLGNRLKIIIVAGAGVVVNVALAIICALVFRGVRALMPGIESHMIFMGAKIFSGFLFYSIIFNVILAMFNLIPLPPLDGSRIFGALLPEKARYMLFKMAPAGIVILIALLATHKIDGLFSWIIMPVIRFLTGM
ncbi:MAG: site-2 protease family protein [Deltaproteobacteria bacterium]|nr:site-2 protease family protein [Deltaproteobacteria bacterium]